jgi:hypothetical protein
MSSKQASNKEAGLGLIELDGERSDGKCEGVVEWFDIVHQVSLHGHPNELVATEKGVVLVFGHGATWED